MRRSWVRSPSAPPIHSSKNASCLAVWSVFFAAPCRPLAACGAASAATPLLSGAHLCAMLVRKSIMHKVRSTKQPSERHASAPDTQNASSFGQRCGNLIVGGDCWAHPWAQPLRAARCGASLRLSNFVPDKIVARGSRVLERTAAKPLARRARRGKRRVTGGFVHTSLSARYAKRPSFDQRRGNLIVDGDCWAHPWAQPLRAARCGASLRLSNFVPDKIVEPKRVRPHLSLRQIRKTPLAGRFAYLAEREGFEPSIRLLTLYSLSRGAPSASRASLRVLPALLRSRQGY